MRETPPNMGPIAMTSSEEHFSRLGAVAAFIGLLIYFVSAVLHPGTAPHHTEAAFAHYATEQNWALIHLGELLGVLLMSAAAVALARRLQGGLSGAWATLGGAAMVVFASVYVVFIAVDGVALGIMVDRWVNAQPEQKPLLFETAFAVRQIEAGLFGMQWFIFGVATALFAVAFAANGTAIGRGWRSGMALLSAVSSLGALAFGIAQAQTGFSELSMSFQIGLYIGVAWILAIGIFLYLHPVPQNGSSETQG